MSDNRSGEDKGASHAGEAMKAVNAMQHVANIIDQMDETLKEEEEILQERAIRLRRQSADAFKLMDDVKKLHRW